MLDYRVVVEAGATVLAAERAGDEDLDLLDALTEHMGASAAASFEVYRRADVRFHIGLAEGPSTSSPR